MEASLSLQRAVFDRLRTDAGVLALVPAANIFDRHGLPSQSPCIILGEGQTVRDPLSLRDNSFSVSLTIHAWSKGTNVVETKRIGGAVVAALRPGDWNVAGFRVLYLRLDDARYMRDPGGEWGHAALGFGAMLIEATS